MSSEAVSSKNLPAEAVPRTSQQRTTTTRRRLVAGALPILFVLVWSSGYLVGGIATRTAAPGALGFWRFTVATAALGIVVLITRAPWPRRRSAWGHLVVSGVLLQTVLYAGTFIALDLGVSAGLTALVTCATPLFVAAAAVPLFGEHLRGRQIAGLIVGIAGVAATVGADLSGLGSIAGLLAALSGLAGFAAGTLYQKRFGQNVDLRTGMFIQLLAATVSIAPLAALTGGFALPLTVVAMGSALWLALVGSIGAFVLLFLLLRHRPGAGATSYLFLVPPVTAVLGAFLLGQPLTAGAVAGITLTAAGVVLVARRPRIRS